MAEEDAGRIVDFTRASPWEEFAGELEEALRQPSPSSNHARLESRVPLVGGRIFLLTDHRGARAGARGPGVPSAGPDGDSLPAYMQAMLAAGPGTFRLDGRFGTERIRRWFGVGDYCVLTPEEVVADGYELDSVEIAAAQGALNAALLQAGRDVPGLVCHHTERGAFTGWAASGRFSTRLDVDCFDAMASDQAAKLRRPEEAVHLFLAKVEAGAPRDAPAPEVRCDAWHTHVISGWPRPPPRPADPEDGSGIAVCARHAREGVAHEAPGVTVTAAGASSHFQVDGVDASAWLGLPEDPVAELHLACGWQGLTPSELVASVADGNAVAFAPAWLLGAHAPEPGAAGTPEGGAVAADPGARGMSGATGVARQAQLANRARALAGAWRHAVGTEATLEAAITRAPLPAALGIDPRAALRAPAPAAVDAAIEALFAPDAPPLAPAVAVGAGTDAGGSPASALPPAEHPGLLPPGSLTAALVRTMAANLSLVAVAHVWRAFLGKVRRCWEERTPLPALGFPDALPQPGTLLLHQKLQMINCCIAQALLVDRARASGATAGVAGAASSCDRTAANGAADTELETAVDGAGAGRARPLPNLLALGDGAQLYEPVTQPPVPMTEDQLMHRIDTLEGVSGGDADAHQLRARLQSSQLRSDMQAFKAANPSCALEDFVRWHSPRDWLVDDEEDMKGAGAAATACMAADSEPAAPLVSPESLAALSRARTGRLSPRMSEPGNLWQQLWTATLPLPSAQQRPLFHAPREAEVALHSLETATATATLHQLLAGVLLSGARAIAALDCASAAETVTEAARRTEAAVGDVPCLTAGGPDAELTGSGTGTWDFACDALARAESAAATAASLQRKLPPPLDTSARILGGLARGEPVAVDDEVERLALARFACVGCGSGEQTAVSADVRRGAPELPEADMQEYVLRAEAPRAHGDPGTCGGATGVPASVHRMYVGVRDEQCRVAIALSTAAL